MPTMGPAVTRAPWQQPLPRNLLRLLLLRGPVPTRIRLMITIINNKPLLPRRLPLVMGQVRLVATVGPRLRWLLLCRKLIRAELATFMLPEVWPGINSFCFFFFFYPAPFVVRSHLNLHCASPSFFFPLIRLFV